MAWSILFYTPFIQAQVSTETFMIHICQISQQLIPITITLRRSLLLILLPTRTGNSF
jgi:hypothetical protein